MCRSTSFGKKYFTTSAAITTEGSAEQERQSQFTRGKEINKQTFELFNSANKMDVAGDRTNLYEVRLLLVLV